MRSWCVLLLLSHFSRVRLCATPQTAAHQALPSLGFSRQEHQSGLPFLFPRDPPDPCLLYWQVDSVPLSHQGSPCVPMKDCRSLLWGSGGGIARGSTGWAFFVSNSAHLPRWPEFGGIPSLREETITVFIWSFSWHRFLFKQIEKICHLSVGVFISYLSSIWWSEESLAMLMIQFLIKV